MENAVLVAKFQVNSVKHVLNQDNKVYSEELQTSAVYSNDPNNPNSQWSKWTPSASLQMNISNEAAFKKVIPGKEYYIYIVPTEA